MCDQEVAKKEEYIEGGLWGDPPLEIRGSVRSYITGLSAKLDTGNVRVWGEYDINLETEWKLLGGPVIGFHYKGI